MNYDDLQNLLNFADINNLMDKPFQEVYNLWQQDMKDAYESMIADDYLSNMEYYESQYA